MGEIDVVNDREISGMGIDESMRLVNDRLYEAWQRRWDESERGRVTYAFIKNVKSVEMCMNFELELYVGYIVTGHGSMNGFLHKRGLSETEACRCGSASEDWKHVLVECPLYDDIRRLEEWDVRLKENGEVDVSGVLECKDRYESLCKFAESAFKRRMRTNE